MSTIDSNKPIINIEQLTAFSAIPADGIHGICLVIALWPHDPDRTHWLELLQLQTPVQIIDEQSHNFSNY